MAFDRACRKRGYLYQEGGILSPDGHCRAFDAAPRGTVIGSGAGVVVLKRLDDALADGDHDPRRDPGTAINNDGACKAATPRRASKGRREVIAAALAIAGVAPASDRLRRGPRHRHPARRSHRGRGAAAGLPRNRGAGCCGLGSVKTNIGHLDAAALDDFGTGYASLSQLQTLPFDRIKIDRSFINSLGENEQSAAIVETITALGRSLHVPITAEGVETPAIREKLAALGCANAQGWYFDAPSRGMSRACNSHPRSKSRPNRVPSPTAIGPVQAISGNSSTGLTVLADPLLI